MEAGTHFQQGTDPSAQGDLAAGWLSDAGKDLEQGALPGSVAANDAQDLSMVDIKGYIPQRLDFIDRRVQFFPAPQWGYHSAAQVDQLVAQGIVALGQGTNAVALA